MCVQKSKLRFFPPDIETLRNFLQRKMVWIVIIVALFFPLMTDYPYYHHIMTMILFYAYLGEAWNIIYGYCGQSSFCNASFFSIGAYVTALMIVWYQVTPYVSMFVGGVVSCILAVFLGFAFFRLRGVYFALGTLVLPEIMRTIFTNWDLVGSGYGIPIPTMNPAWLYMDWLSKIPYYYIMLILCTIIVIFTKRLENSNLGLYLKAIKANEDRCISLGINTFKYKIYAFALSAFFTSFAGTFHAQYVHFIDPDSTLAFYITMSIILPPILGGTGTYLGPIVGSLILTPLGEFIRVYSIQFHMLGGLHLFISGIIMISMSLFCPEGLIVRLRQVVKTKR